MNFDFTLAMIPPRKPIGDPWYNKTILRVMGDLLPFKVGDKVNIVSPLYNGVHEIGYIYNGLSSEGNYYNLYFQDLDFKGTTTGTVTLGTGAVQFEKTIAPEAKVVEMLTADPLAKVLEQVQAATAEPLRDNGRVLYTAESRTEQPVPAQPAAEVQSLTAAVEDTAKTVVEKANALPSRWFYAILFAIAIAVFIYFQNKD